MGKAKREEKKAKREAEAAAREEARVAMARRRQRLGRVLVALPLLTVAVAVGIYFGTDDRPLAALAGLFGIVLWVPVLLTFIGSSVPPRDRGRAGAIDFGSKR